MGNTCRRQRSSDSVRSCFDRASTSNSSFQLSPSSKQHTVWQSMSILYNPKSLKENRTTSSRFTNKWILSLITQMTRVWALIYTTIYSTFSFLYWSTCECQFFPEQLVLLSKPNDLLFLSVVLKSLLLKLIWRKKLFFYVLLHGSIKNYITKFYGITTWHVWPSLILAGLWDSWIFVIYFWYTFFWVTNCTWSPKGTRTPESIKGNKLVLNLALSKTIQLLIITHLCSKTSSDKYLYHSVERSDVWSLWSAACAPLFPVTFCSHETGSPLEMIPLPLADQLDLICDLWLLSDLCPE